MDFELPEDVRMLREVVREFAERELRPLAREMSWGESVSDELLKPLQAKLKEMGLWLIDVPQEYGGPGLSLVARCVVEEEVARTIVLPFGRNELFGPVVGPILYYCNDEQKERFLYPVINGQIRVCFAQTEPDAGSDPSSIRTRAVRQGDHYVLNGVKRFISAAERADYAQVVCVTDPAKGARGGISVLLVDLKSPGVRLERQWPTIAGDGPWEIVFDNVRVPIENRIGEEGQGFELGQRHLTMARVRSHGARMLGIAEEALRLAMSYAKQRVTFGQPLTERQAVQFMIADSAMELRAARLMVYETAWRFDQGYDVRNESYMTKITAVEMATRVVDRAIQIHGGIGLTKELPLEYWYRYLRTARVTEGVTEVLRWRLARNLIRAQG